MESKQDLKNNLLESIPAMLQIFNEEPTLLHITGSTMVVGDIHGSIESLMVMVEEWEASDNKNLLFLGDYVDRGMQGLECLQVLFNLKLKHPNRVFLLRGNHEDAEMNMYYGFYDEVGNDDKFIVKMHRVFETMPVAAVLENNVFCVHGGITEDADLNHISKNNSFQYLWNDPYTKSGVIGSRRGEGIKQFGEDVVDNFLSKNGLQCIIRSHEYCENGYQSWFNGKLVTVFSVFDYCGMSNRAAYAVYKEKEVSLYVFE